MDEISYKSLRKKYNFYGKFLLIGIVFLLIFSWATFDGKIKKYQWTVK